MEVVYWEGGLLRHEVEAIESMEKVFKSANPVGAPQATKSRPGKEGMAQCVFRPTVTGCFGRS